MKWLTSVTFRSLRFSLFVRLILSQVLDNFFALFVERIDFCYASKTIEHAMPLCCQTPMAVFADKYFSKACPKRHKKLIWSHNFLLSIYWASTSAEKFRNFHEKFFGVRRQIFHFSFEFASKSNLKIKKLLKWIGNWIFWNYLLQATDAVWIYCIKTLKPKNKTKIKKLKTMPQKPKI